MRYMPSHMQHNKKEICGNFIRQHKFQPWLNCIKA